ncbi:MAG: hypothetical protein WAL22_17360 [Solirubrobacteraceae bacterium]
MPFAAAGVAVALLAAVAVDPPAEAAVVVEALEPHAATSTLAPISAVTAPIRYLILRSRCMFTPGVLGIRVGPVINQDAARAGSFPAGMTLRVRLPVRTPSGEAGRERSAAGVRD